jgi:hypothetical protein
MKSHSLTAIVAAAAMIGAPSFTSTAFAQLASSGSSGNYIVPVMVGAAAGATVGALLWPAMVPRRRHDGRRPGGSWHPPGYARSSSLSATAPCSYASSIDRYATED